MAQDEVGLSAVTLNIIVAVGADQKVIQSASIDMSSSCQAVADFVSFRFSIEAGLMVKDQSHAHWRTVQVMP